MLGLAISVSVGVSVSVRVSATFSVSCSVNTDIGVDVILGTGCIESHHHIALEIIRGPHLPLHRPSLVP